MKFQVIERESNKGLGCCWCGQKENMLWKIRVGKRARGARSIRGGFVRRAELEDHRIFLVLLTLPLSLLSSPGLRSEMVGSAGVKGPVRFLPQLDFLVLWCLLRREALKTEKGLWFLNEKKTHLYFFNLLLRFSTSCNCCLLYTSDAADETSTV